MADWKIKVARMLVTQSEVEESASLSLTLDLVGMG